CGGTHVGGSTEIGLLKIVSEGSVGANLRRIEAITSFDAMEYIRAEEAELLAAAEAMKVPSRDVAERAAALVRRVKELETAGERVKESLSEGEIAALADGAIDAGYRVVVARVAPGKAEEMRNLWDVLRARLGESGAAVLASTDPDGGAPLLLAAGTPDAVAAGFDAGAIIRAIAPAICGGGGGKAEMAQAGGKNADGIDEALRLARAALGVQ
ncbi:MAG: DHHA1 domain-containing protein, partial [Actinomycetota bacterium]|nr:DHHA1 domain-containing protein [Actinomycetota bacterium]